MAINPPQFSKIEVPFDKILARLGYAYGATKLDQHTERIIKEEMENGKRLIIAHQAVASSAITIPGPGIVLIEPGLTIRSHKIAELLAGCVTAYGFAVTIGGHLEEQRNQYLNRRETARALILDAIGSVAVEELAELTQQGIADEAAKANMTATRRFSPGYGDWALSEQKEFLRWLGATNIGIRLTERFTMLPEKSISAILGVKPK
jgi:hypothetical protein